MYNYKYYCVNLVKFMKRQKTLCVNENILIDIMIIRGLDYIRYNNAKSLMYKFYLNKMYSGESYGQIEIIIAEKHIKNYLKVKKESIYT